MGKQASKQLWKVKRMKVILGQDPYKFSLSKEPGTALLANKQMRKRQIHMTGQIQPSMYHGLTWAINSSTLLEKCEEGD